MNCRQSSTFSSSMNRTSRFRSAALHVLVVSLMLLGGSSSSNAAASFDVNDVSFLWPVPKNANDVKELISADDKLNDGTPMWSTDVFKQVMNQAQTVKVGTHQIGFPNNTFTDPHNWKVVWIRVNPSALGTSEALLKQLPQIPGIRLIVQPVTVDAGGNVKVHDFTAHVVFNYVKQVTAATTPASSLLPDKDAFRCVIKSLEEIKAQVEAKIPTVGDLNIHPGFASDLPGLRDSLRSFLAKHLNSARLDAVSFMGIPKQFEPWIFFGIKKQSNGQFAVRTVSGNFTPPGPTSQMLSFASSPSVEPAQTLDAAKGLTTASTALLFDGSNDNVKARLETPLFPGTTDPQLAKLKFGNIPDLIANPERNNTLTTDCVSCHTESTRRADLGIASDPSVAFQRPAGISGVAKAMLPKDKWNVRDFGWFPRGATELTITQRAANEAAESADFINRNYLNTTAPTSCL